VLYREETNDERDMFIVLWDKERNKTSRTRISRTLWKIAACPMSYYSVSHQQAGFVAVWPTKGDVYFARLDGTGTPQSPAESKTPGTTEMRTGLLALSADDGSTLVAWKKNHQLAWQLYDPRGRPSGSPSSAASAGKGVAGVLAKNGNFVLFK